MARVAFYLRHLLLLLLLLLIVIVSWCDSFSNAQTSSSDSIEMAIERSRQHLLHNTPKHAPNAFPNTRYRLALMLESSVLEDTSDTSHSRDDVVKECIDLYQSAAANTTNTPSLTRITALHRAAKLMMQHTHDGETSLGAELLLFQALEIEKDNAAQELAPLHASVFETLIILLLTRASLSSKEQEVDILESALRLCQSSAIKCPDEPVIDEYMGVVLRKLKGKGSETRRADEQSSRSEALQVYRCYEQAAKKSHNAAILASFPQETSFPYAYGSLPTSSATISESDTFVWNRLVRHVILAACSAREAGLLELERDQFVYGLTILSKFGTIVAPDIQGDFYTNIGIRYKRMEDMQRASEYFERALEAHPQDGHALVQLASIDKLSSSRSVERLDDAYVAGLFDGYSDRFENELVQDLQYKGHELVADALFSQNKWLHDNAIVVVDLGCGTGLLGSLLRSRLLETAPVCNTENGKESVTIYGVDLSPRMATMSRAKQIVHDEEHIQVYDDLRVSDATQFLGSMPSNSVNAIAASDVFIYVGALDTVFEECERVLSSGGLLCFTVELPPTKGMTLLKSGRFGHSQGYVQEVATKAGFAVLEWKDDVLRKQGGQDVRGAVVTLVKKK